MAPPAPMNNKPSDATVAPPPHMTGAKGVPMNQAGNSFYGNLVDRDSNDVANTVNGSFPDSIMSTNAQDRLLQ